MDPNYDIHKDNDLMIRWPIVIKIIKTIDFGKLKK